MRPRTRRAGLATLLPALAMTLMAATAAPAATTPFSTAPVSTAPVSTTPFATAPFSTTPVGAAPAGTAACPQAGAPVVVAGRGDVQVFAVQDAQRPAAASSYRAIADEVRCLFARDVAPYRDPRVPGLVVLNELTTLDFALAGSRGAAARALAASPAGGLAGQQTNQPLGALAGALGLVGAAYSREIAFYASRFPRRSAAELAGDGGVLVGGQARIPADRIFLAATDTYVRAIWDSFARQARRYRVEVVVGAVLPTLDGARACAAAGYRGWVACPGWHASTAPADVAALADPDLLPRYARGQLHSVFVADTPWVHNVALVFGPDGRLVDLQPKVNLTPIESELGWRPAPVTTVHAIRLLGPAGRVVPAVRLGIAISLDAFEHAGGSHPCADPAAYVACLDRRRVNVLLQPEFNDGVPHCPSWSTFSATCAAPVWQPLAWMLSSWYDVEATRPDGTPVYPSLRYAVNPFLVGNLYDLTGDGQSAIIARNDPRAHRDAYAGDFAAADYRVAGADTPYPDPAALAPLDGPQGGFLALAPWVLPASGPAGAVRARSGLGAGDPSSLQSCEQGLVPDSGVSTGPCRENAYRTTVLVAELRLG